MGGAKSVISPCTVVSGNTIQALTKQHTNPEVKHSLPSDSQSQHPVKHKIPGVYAGKDELTGRKSNAGRSTREMGL